MQVVFHRTGRRRYAVRVVRPGHATLQMDPAPGYDNAVPHDLFHFVVEQELTIPLGVFGQLAAGGDAGTFHLAPQQRASRSRSRDARRIKARGRNLAAAGRADAEFSERAVGLCEIEWAGRSRRQGSDSEAPTISPRTRGARARLPEADQEALTDAAIHRICRRLTEVAESWSSLGVGGNLTFEWS